MRDEFPDLTFDFTAKVEHILKQRSLMPEFARLGCLFVVSAVESLSDTVLAHLEKGHTRADVAEMLDILNGAGIAPRPSFVSFTPWTTIDDYIEALEFIEEHGLINHVDAVQYSIRLLIPPGSLLLARAETAAWIGPLNQESFTCEWRHPDPRMDELHKQVSALVERAAGGEEEAEAIFCGVRNLAYAARGSGSPARARPRAAPLRLKPPRLTEAWFC
jgi:hypothetical protein